LRFLPIVAFITTVGLISAVTSDQASAQNVYTTPVGFVNVPITNTSGGYNTYALPLQQLQNDQGLVTGSVASNTLTVACTTCASTNYGLSTALNYIEFNTGAGVGRYYAIQTNDASGDLTLSTGNDNLTTVGGSGVAIGDSYTIRPFFRIQDCFGTFATTALHASNTQSRADNVLVWNGSSYNTYFINSNTGNWTPNGTDPILPDESVYVLRRAATQTNLMVLGAVKTTNYVTDLELGYNLVGNSVPATMVISNMNLISAGSGFQGSNTQSRSDNVLVWNGSSYDTLFYNTNTGNWSPSNSYAIFPTSTYFIYLKHQGGEWQRPLPYSP
jgi:hypothetical protein